MPTFRCLFGSGGSRLSSPGHPFSAGLGIRRLYSIVRVSEYVVDQAANAGSSVIVGRGSQHFLRERNDTLRFYLYASKTGKVRRLITVGKNNSETEELVDTVDRERADSIQAYFHAEWPNRSIYRAMFNTDAGEEMMVRAILGFYRECHFSGIAGD